MYQHEGSDLFFFGGGGGPLEVAKFPRENFFLICRKIFPLHKPYPYSERIGEDSSILGT